MLRWQTFRESRDVQAIANKAKLDISQFSLKQVKMGFEEELEHGKKSKSLNVTNDDPVKTLKIALTHLREDPEYYTKLKRTFN